MSKIGGPPNPDEPVKNPHSLVFAVPPVFRISSVQTLGGVDWVLDVELEVIDFSPCFCNLYHQLCDLKKCLYPFSVLTFLK